uniref:Rab5 GDP/GTP exchange factor n=1 Tax=Meloidogyne javanica TaxID=6303 RepID=A0A915MP09_MELJA
MSHRGIIHESLQQQQDERRLLFHLSDNELLCKNQCGFYGTPQCKGFCSQCWKNYQLENKRLYDYNKNKELLRKETTERNIASKTSDVRQTFRTLLKKSPSVFSNDQLTSQQQQSSSLYMAPTILDERSSSPDSSTSLADFQKYLSSTFSFADAKELEKQCRDELAPIDDLSNSVQLFYQTMRDEVNKIKSLPPDFNFAKFMTEIETFVCVTGYHILFGSRTEEETEDLSLQTRIRSLNWVTNGFLETALDESSAQVQEYMDEAITEIVDLNKSRFGAPASADEFLPVLILIVLKANPPLIQSNLKFVCRFGLPSRHMRGEYGYYFTNLSSAIYFIQDMRASSLQLTDEEFEDYTSGKRIPTSFKNSISTYVMRSIGNSIKRIDGLLSKQVELVGKVEQLEAGIERDSEQFKCQVNEFINQDYPDEIKKIIENNKKAAKEEENSGS